MDQTQDGHGRRKLPKRFRLMPRSAREPGPRLRRFALGVGLLLALGACASLGLSDSDSTDDSGIETPREPDREIEQPGTAEDPAQRERTAEAEAEADPESQADNGSPEDPESTADTGREAGDGDGRAVSLSIPLVEPSEPSKPVEYEARERHTLDSQIVGDKPYRMAQPAIALRGDLLPATYDSLLAGEPDKEPHHGSEVDAGERAVSGRGEAAVPDGGTDPGGEGIRGEPEHDGRPADDGGEPPGAADEAPPSDPLDGEPPAAADEAAHDDAADDGEPAPAADEEPQGASERENERTPAADEEPPVDQRITTRVDTQLSVVLEGRGWIFLGERNGNSAVELDNRVEREGTTEFTFTTRQPGTYIMEFSRQNLSEGSSEAHSAEIVATEEGAEEDDPFARPPVPDRVPSPAAAAREDSDNVTIDPEELLDVSEPDEEEPIDETGQTVDEGEDPGVMSVHGYDEAELRSMLEQALGDEDPDMTGAIVAELRGRGLFLDSEVLESASELLNGAGRHDAARDAYEWWLSLYDGESASDRIHFALAELYENSGTTIGIRRSAEHYRHVAEEYPRSSHARDAERRARHLRRHFVDVR